MAPFFSSKVLLDNHITPNSAMLGSPMAARKPHPKSKLGCTQCKQRRVKCDESRPGCENCRKRGTTCSFRTFDPVPGSSPLAMSTPGKTGPIVHVFPQKAEDPSAILPAQNLMDACVRHDLLVRCSVSNQSLYEDVLRHFTTDTIPSYSAGAACRAAWCNTLPDLAAKHTFVTRGMLAIGLLHISHLATTTEETRESYQKKAATQMNAAMDQYRVEVRNVSIENANALFAFSSLLTLFVLSTSANECSLALNDFRTDGKQCGHAAKLTSSMVHTICRVFRSIRGVLVILVPCWNHLQSGPLQSVVLRDWWPAAVPETKSDIQSDEKLGRLEKMWSRPDRAYDYSFDTLRLALKSLRESFALVSRLERLGATSKENGNDDFDWTSVINWPVQLTLDFLLLLEQQRTEAWVIAAHFAILPAKARDVPWLGGLPENIITTAALVIGEEHWTWIAWPVEAVGLDLKLLLQNPVAASIPTAFPLHHPSLEADHP